MTSPQAVRAAGAAVQKLAGRRSEVLRKTAGELIELLETRAFVGRCNLFPPECRLERAWANAMMRAARCVLEDAKAAGQDLPVLDRTKGLLEQIKRSPLLLEAHEEALHVLSLALKMIQGRPFTPGRPPVKLPEGWGEVGGKLEEAAAESWTRELKKQPGWKEVGRLKRPARDAATKAVAQALDAVRTKSATVVARS